MKVLMTADCVGGVWTYALELIAGLAAYGVHVRLATLGRKLSTAQRLELDMLDNVELCESQYRLEWMEDPWEDVSAAGRWLLALRDDYNPDLIHLNNFAHGDLPWNVPVLMVAHSCVCSWTRAVRGEEVGPQWSRYRRCVAAGLRGADAIIAPSRHMLNALGTHYGLSTQGDVIYNGRSQPAACETQREPMILAAGRLWDEAKNIGMLSEVAQQVPWPILVAGDAVHPDSRHSVKWEGLSLLGELSQQQLRSLMSRAAIYALPAKYEPFGLTALEAALAGCAMVLADIESLREIWDDAAIYESPHSAEGWAARLNALIESPPMRAQLAQRASQRARRYTVQRMAAQYYCAYQRLTKPGQRPPSLSHLGAAV